MFVNRVAVIAGGEGKPLVLRISKLAQCFLIFFFFLFSVQSTTAGLMRDAVCSGRLEPGLFDEPSNRSIVHSVRTSHADGWAKLNADQMICWPWLGPYPYIGAHESVSWTCIARMTVCSSNLFGCSPEGLFRCLMT